MEWIKALFSQNKPMKQPIQQIRYDKYGDNILLREKMLKNGNQNTNYASSESIKLDRSGSWENIKHDVD
jgi:hypothetical protein